MADFPKVESSGSINQQRLGEGEHGLSLGGQAAYPFHTFDGSIPNPPALALEIHDRPPTDWPEALNEIYSEVYADPANWARKCVELGADALVLTLTSIDPNGDDASAESAVETVKAVAAAIDRPLIVWGVDNEPKDGEVLRAVAEAIDGRRLVLGPVVEGNYKQVGAGAIGFKHMVAANSPIDINLAKQLSILLGNLGVHEEDILIDPTTGGLGYGLEYSYSVMERARIAALVQGDEKLQFPMLNMVGKEVWKSKEAKVSADQQPTWGDARARGISIECITGVSLLLAGSDLLVLRHPESLKRLRAYIAQMVQ
ncbi:MAG: acetyl-CoA decarbonylase/synthase complex subunit delta [Candidatus Alcyoniella australis]|nr:acetyl-CoA decarbonylase/synthase complex subunit delta [Candidatus Alcyoniella australis]